MAAQIRMFGVHLNGFPIFGWGFFFRIPSSVSIR